MIAALPPVLTRAVNISLEAQTEALEADDESNDDDEPKDDDKSRNDDKSKDADDLPSPPSFPISAERTTLDESYRTEDDSALAGVLVEKDIVEAFFDKRDRKRYVLLPS
jgi:hypothetical protein